MKRRLTMKTLKASIRGALQFWSATAVPRAVQETHESTRQQRSAPGAPRGRCRGLASRSLPLTLSSTPALIQKQVCWPRLIAQFSFDVHRNTKLFFYDIASLEKNIFSYIWGERRIRKWCRRKKRGKKGHCKD